MREDIAPGRLKTAHGRMPVRRTRRAARLLLAAATVLLLSPAAALAEETTAETEEQPARTRDVVVTATRTEHDLKDVPSSAAVVDQEDLKRSPAINVADALRDVPGVEVFDLSVPGAKRVQIRGESGQRVLVLIDGQKISEQKSMDGAALLIDPNRIERIEVIKGSASVLYGSEAIGGVINIITKKGGEKPISVETSVTFDSSTDGFAEYLSAFGGMNGFKYRVSGTYSDQGNRRSADGEMDDTSYMSRDNSAFLGYDADKASFGVTYDEYWSNLNSMTPEGTTGDTLYNFDLDIPLWERRKAGAYAEFRDISELVSRVRVDGFYQEVTKEMINIIGVKPTSMLTIDQDQWTRNEQASWGGTMQVDLLPHENHHVILGYDMNLDDLDATTEILQTITMFGSSTSTFTKYDYDATMDTHAVYLQDEWTLPADFALTLGVRQTWVRSELEETNNPSLDTDTRSASHPVFSAGLTWAGIQDTTLRALFSQGYRFPNLQQLYIGTVHGSSDPTYPNPDLDPETSNNYEVGARYDNGALNLDVAFFMSNAKDYITTTAVTGGSQFTNVDEADTYGIEASAGYTFRSLFLTPYASGTWLKRHYDSGTLDTWDTGHPEYMGRLGVRFDRDLPERKLNLFADLYMRAAVDAREEYSDGTSDNYEAWETLNLSLGTKFGEERQHFVSLELLNILNRDYQTAASSIDEPGMHAVVKVGTTF